MDPAHSGTETSNRNIGLTAETPCYYQVRASNDDVATGWSGPASSTTQATPNHPDTGTPAITGMARVRQTLAVDTSSVADQDRLQNAAFSYQWLADDAEIAGVTSSTYTLGDADDDKPIQVLRCGRHASRSPPILMTAGHPGPPNGGRIIRPDFK